MALDFQQVRKQVQVLGENARQREQELKTCASVPASC